MLRLLVAYYQKTRGGKWSRPGKGLVYGSGYWLILQYSIILYTTPKHKQQHDDGKW